MHSGRLDTYAKIRADVTEIARAKSALSAPMEVDTLKGTGKGKDKGKGKGKGKEKGKGKGKEDKSGAETPKGGHMLLLQEVRAQEGGLQEATG